MGQPHGALDVHGAYELGRAVVIVDKGYVGHVVHGGPHSNDDSPAPRAQADVRLDVAARLSVGAAGANIPALVFFLEREQGKGENSNFAVVGADGDETRCLVDRKSPGGLAHVLVEKGRRQALFGGIIQVPGSWHRTQPTGVVCNLLCIIGDYVAIVVACDDNLLLTEHANEDVVDTMRPGYILAPADPAAHKRLRGVEFDVWGLWNRLLGHASGHVCEYLAHICNKIQLKLALARARAPAMRNRSQCTLRASRCLPVARPAARPGQAWRKRGRGGGWGTVRAYIVHLRKRRQVVSEALHLGYMGSGRVVGLGLGIGHGPFERQLRHPRVDQVSLLLADGLARASSKLEPGVSAAGGRHGRRGPAAGCSSPVRRPSASSTCPPRWAGRDGRRPACLARSWRRSRGGARHGAERTRPGRHLRSARVGREEAAVGRIRLGARGPNRRHGVSGGG